MNKSQWKKKLSLYRLRKRDSLNRMSNCTGDQFINLGLELKALAVEFKLKELKAFGVDRYESHAWVIYRALEKTSCTGMDAINLVHKFRYQ